MAADRIDRGDIISDNRGVAIFSDPWSPQFLLVPAGTSIGELIGDRVNTRNLVTLELAARQLFSADDFAWLADKRWFADKGRAIADIAIVNLSVSALADVTLLLTVVEVKFEAGESSFYFTPMIVAGRSDSGHRVGDREDVAPLLVDALSRPEFGRWVAGLFSRAGERAIADGWSANVSPQGADSFHSQTNIDARALGAEQSNSSIRIGEKAILKVLRRINHGENPEDEILRALRDFQQLRIPGYLGSLYWRDPEGRTYTVGIAQSWMPNQGDGWSWVLTGLHRIAQTHVIEPATIEALGALGERTASLHLALSAASGEAFGGHAASEVDMAAVREKFYASLARSQALISEVASALPEELGKKAHAIVTALTGLSVVAEGFAAEEGTARIRVHGDYHLGQVLRTTDDDWTIIDFEGEPARSLDERRERSSALRDVAGMLRSFSYARAVVEHDLNAGAEERAVLREWEAQARAAFVSRYRDALSSGGFNLNLPLVPQSESEFEQALSAWEADKALYEVAYEARNRPAWVGIPLRALLPDLLDHT